MLRFVVRRLLSGAVLVVVLSSLAYLLLYISAGNIARNILGQSATEETVELKKQELGLDQPLLGHAHQQGIECARQEPRFLHHVIAMPPFPRPRGERRKECAHLLRRLPAADHAVNTTYVELRVKRQCGEWRLDPPEPARLAGGRSA